MKSVLLLVAFILSPVLSGWGQGFNFYYWIPYVDTVHYGSSGNFHYLAIYAFEETNIQVCGNFKTIAAGDSIHIDWPLFKEGSIVASDRPIEVIYFFFPYHFGIYEDGTLEYCVLEKRLLGTEYAIPISCGEVSILAIQDNTTICIDGQLFCLNAGNSKRFHSVPIGTEITSNHPVSVVAANYSSDHYSSTYAFQVCPFSLLGTTYFSPKQHAYTYQNSIDSTRIYLLAVDDETELVIDNDTVVLNKYEYLARPAIDEVRIISEKPFYAVYLNDIYGKDPWAGVFRHYQIAFQMLPADFPVHEALIEPIVPTYHGFPMVQVCITSLADNNEISLSSGESSEIITLNYGDRAYFHEGDLLQWSDYPLDIKSLEAMQVTATIRYWWNSIAETTFGRALYGKMNALYCSASADPQQICLGDTCQLHATAFGGSGNLNYSWTSDPPGFASSIPDPSFAPLVSTVFYVEVRDQNNATCQSSLFVNVSPAVNFSPLTEACVYDSVTLDAGNEGAEYLWSNGSTERTITIGATGIGHDILPLTVTISTPDGCVATIPCTIVFDFSYCSGIGDQPEDSGFLLYPNPAEEEVAVTVGGQQSAVGGPLRLSMYDLFGREVRSVAEDMHSPGEFTIRIDVSDLPEGVYLVRVQAGEESAVKKLVVQ